MGFSVRDIYNSNDLQDIVNQINVTNNEITRDVNLLKVSLKNREDEIARLKRDIDSLNIKLGEFSASKPLMNINKRAVSKNLKLGETEESTVKTSTLFRATDGSLKWSDTAGALTVIVP